MQLEPSEEQRALADTVAKWADSRYDWERRRSYLGEPGGYSRDNLKALAELGVLALGVPESAGGLGGTDADMAAVMEALGYRLVVEPVLPSIVMAGGLLADAGSPGQIETYLAPAMEGETALTVAFAEPQARFNLLAVETDAKLIKGGFELSGRKTVVPGDATYEAVIVPAREADTLSLFIVPLDAKGLRATPHRLVDGAPAMSLDLDAVLVPESARLGEAGQGEALLCDMAARTRILASAEMLGAMQMVFDQTLDYLKTRVQFGRPIGKNQALQHRMAEHLVRLEQSRSALARALNTSHETTELWHREAAAAKGYISQAAMEVGQDAIQMHGAMGTTEELIVSHGHKRLLYLQSLLGDASHHYRLVNRMAA